MHVVNLDNYGEAQDAIRDILLMYVDMAESYSGFGQTFSATKRWGGSAYRDLAYDTSCSCFTYRGANRAFSVSVATSSGGSQASSTCAADPAVIGSSAPTGTVSRSPLCRSAAATQRRIDPSRR